MPTKNEIQSEQKIVSPEVPPLSSKDEFIRRTE